MNQRYGTDPSRRYGTGVWNGGMERVWSRNLFRTSYFDLHPYVFFKKNETVQVLHLSHSPSIQVLSHYIQVLSSV